MIELYNGDCLDVIKTIPNNSVDLTVTSPPYDNLRTYNGNIDQWNFDKFKAIAKELYRVTANGGVIVWVVGDATIKGSETGTSFKQALYFKEIGFNLHDTMIYEKAQACFGSNLCYLQSFEYMFVFSKGKPKTINFIRDRKNVRSGVESMGMSGLSKDGKKSGRHYKEMKEYGKRKNIWCYGVGGGKTGHPAVFPEQLANDHILSWSNDGDTVLDCFMGSGTTSLAARNLKRNSIGYEINPDFIKYYKQKVESSMLFDNSTCVYKKDESSFDIYQKLMSLPYRFNDPHKMENKIDVKKLQFGSKIDKDSKEREDYYSVKDVVSPNKLLLSNGVTVRLIGVKEKPSVNGAATKFLAEKTKGRKVFMRYDSVKYDSDNTLLCYLYLDNKTFINAHLLKNGLVDVDDSMDFKYKNKFEKLINA